MAKKSDFKLKKLYNWGKGQSDPHIVLEDGGLMKDPDPSRWLCTGEGTLAFLECFNGQNIVVPYKNDFDLYKIEAFCAKTCDIELFSEITDQNRGLENIYIVEGMRYNDIWF